MLTIPSSNSWCSKAFVAPACGLYLCNVEYKKEDLDNNNEFSGIGSVDQKAT